MWVMATQLHKRFSDKNVKSLIRRYLSREIDIKYVLEILGIKRSRFFELLKEYCESPNEFSIFYPGGYANRKVAEDMERNIVRELGKEKRLIENKEIPIRGKKEWILFSQTRKMYP
jgi:hypothetical protein